MKYNAHDLRECIFFLLEFLVYFFVRDADSKPHQKTGNSVAFRSGGCVLVRLLFMLIIVDDLLNILTLCLILIGASTLVDFFNCRGLPIRDNFINALPWYIYTFTYM